MDIKGECLNEGDYEWVAWGAIFGDRSCGRFPANFQVIRPITKI